jgi:hypothetical protein
VDAGHAATGPSPCGALLTGWRESSRPLRVGRLLPCVERVAGAGTVGDDGLPVRVLHGRTQSGHGAPEPFPSLTSPQAKAQGRATVPTVRSSWGGSDAPGSWPWNTLDALGDHADIPWGRQYLSRCHPLVLLASLIGLSPLAHNRPPDPVWIRDTSTGDAHDGVPACSSHRLDGFYRSAP